MHWIFTLLLNDLSLYCLCNTIANELILSTRIRIFIIKTHSLGKKPIEWLADGVLFPLYVKCNFIWNDKTAKCNGCCIQSDFCHCEFQFRTIKNCQEWDNHTADNKRTENNHSKCTVKSINLTDSYQRGFLQQRAKDV